MGFHVLNELMDIGGPQGDAIRPEGKSLENWNPPVIKGDLGGLPIFVFFFW